MHVYMKGVQHPYSCRKTLRRRWSACIRRCCWCVCSPPASSRNPYRQHFSRRFPRVPQLQSEYFCTQLLLNLNLKIDQHTPRPRRGACAFSPYHISRTRAACTRQLRLVPTNCYHRSFPTYCLRRLVRYLRGSRSRPLA